MGLSYVDDVPVFGTLPATATFLWERGEMKNIGGLGGHFTESGRLHGIATHCNTLQAKRATIGLLKKACKITNTLYKKQAHTD